jgi:prophage maintenance system killer protein
MGRESGKGDAGSQETAGPTRKGSYSSSHESGGILPKEPRQSSASAEDARPPGFPSVEELKELNREIHDDAGSPELCKLDQPSPLESCLARARAAYADTPEGVIETAALLAHGIAEAQSFFDGNRRTAYFATLTFLEENGYADLSPRESDDHSLARHLKRTVDAQYHRRPKPEDLVRLFTRRLERRRSET